MFFIDLRLSFNDSTVYIFAFSCKSMDSQNEIEKCEWFRSWFDSPYYHMLYRHRDESEAQLFLDSLLSKYHLPQDAMLLDLACGKGRHSIYLHSKGYKVMGVDLSNQSIELAKKAESTGLHFQVQDMRHFQIEDKFDCIFNLFTSFGYFNDAGQNQLVLDRIKEHLLPDGLFVLDYFNSESVIRQFCPTIRHSCGDVVFDVNKKIADNQIVKEITVIDGAKTLVFEEHVQLLMFDEICSMLEKSGLEFIEVFGSYTLEEFEPTISDRMIIIARNS